jgi:hypothetical protein
MYRATAVPVDQFQLQVHQLVMAVVVQLVAVEAQPVQQPMAEVRVTTMERQTQAAAVVVQLLPLHREQVEQAVQELLF